MQSNDTKWHRIIKNNILQSRYTKTVSSRCLQSFCFGLWIGLKWAKLVKRFSNEWIILMPFAAILCNSLPFSLILSRSLLFSAILLFSYSLAIINRRSSLSRHQSVGAHSVAQWEQSVHWRIDFTGIGRHWTIAMLLGADVLHFNNGSVYSFTVWLRSAIECNP